MRKIKLTAIILILILMASCYANQKPQDDDNNKVEVKSIDKKAATVVMENYMTYVLTQNIAGMRSFYTKKYVSEMKEVPKVNEPHPVGYKIEKGQTKEKNIVFKTHVYNSYTSSPYFSDDIFSYTLAQEDNRILVDEVEKDGSTELYVKDNKLYKRVIEKEDEKVKELQILSTNELPEYVIPQGASLPEQKFPVPREAFGPCAISSDGKSIVATSTKEHTFLCLIKIKDEEDSEAIAQGEDKQNEDKKSSGDSKDESTQNQEKNVNQIPKAKVTIVPIDYYLGGKVKNISFSEDDKMFLVEYIPPAAISRIAVYEVSKKQIKLKLDETFRADRYFLTSPFFQGEDTIKFKAEAISGATDDEKKLNGYWQVDIKTGKLTQINI